MKKRIKILIISLAILIPVCLNYLIMLPLFSETMENHTISRGLIILDSLDKDSLKSSNSWFLTPIFIDDNDPNYDWSKIANDNAWCFGNGSVNNPYTIENVTIDGQNSASCIVIRNSNISYFRIRWSVLFNSDPDPDEGGIKLYNASKGLIFNNTCYNNNIGIYLVESNYNTIKKNLLYFNTKNAGQGLRIYGGNNNSILNNNIKNNKGGLWLDGAPGSCQFNNVSQNLLFNNSGEITLANDCNNNFLLYNNISGGHEGISTYRADFNTIQGNQISEIENPGIWLDTSDNNFIMNNSIKNCNSGIFIMRFSNGNYITDNIINIIGSYGIYFINSNEMEKNINNTILGNIITGFGVRVDFSIEEADSTTMDTSNLINGKPLYYYSNKTGLTSNDFQNPGLIILINCNNTLISDFQMDNGIFLRYCHNGIISRNTVSNGDAGIFIEKSSSIAIKNNNLYSNGVGIGLRDSDYNNITDNTISNNIEGIYMLPNSDFNEISRNKIDSNDFIGIDLLECNNNSLVNNFILNHSQSGIFVRFLSHNNTLLYNAFKDNNIGLGIDSLSNDSIIYNNFFVGNLINGDDNGTNNQWDDGVIGNYWDNYIGTDNNYDGIGDIPYNVTGLSGSQDRFPIWNVSTPIITVITPDPNDLFGINNPSFEIDIVDIEYDTTWYTLDGGKTNVTFSGFSGTINQTEWDKINNGTANLTFFVSKFWIFIGYAEVTIRKDILAPTITIYQPTLNQEFSDVPPIFNISIDEMDLERVWYTVDGGLTNHTISGLTGSINEVAWDNLPEGDVILTFYAKDKVGNSGVKSILISKRIETKAILGYDIFLLLGLVSVISIILISTKYKK